MRSTLSRAARKPAASQIASSHGRIELDGAEGSAMDASEPSSCRQEETAWGAVVARRGCLIRRQARLPDRFDDGRGDGDKVIRTAGPDEIHGTGVEARMTGDPPGSHAPGVA